MHFCCALQAVFVDSDNTVLYGSNCSVGLLTADNTLILPPDEDGLANFAVQELAAHTLEVRVALPTTCVPACGVVSMELRCLHRCCGGVSI